MEIKAYVKERKLELKNIMKNLDVVPHLVIIQINEDDGSNAYVRGKIKDLDFVNMRHTFLKLPLDTKMEDLLAIIQKYNNDDDVDGILVQMPLPDQIDEEEVKRTISPLKDVDGFHPESKYSPCTPKGILDYLKYCKVDFVGKNALVVGRSNIVGKPMAKLLLKEHCNVTVVHSRTSKEDLAFYAKHADIIVVAVGKKYIFNQKDLKPTAVLVDVGINRVDGHLYGDCEPNLPVALQTPVPGGVGLLTRLTLLENLYLCYLTRRK